MTSERRSETSIVLNRTLGFVPFLLLAVLALGAHTVRGGERITLVGPWTRIVPGEEPKEFGAPASFEPVGGTVTYERRFTIDFEIPEAVVLLHFDGIGGLGEFTLNDVYLGQKEGLTPFWFDVSEFLKPTGQDNLLVVEIDDKRGPTTIPFEDAPWVGYSGIVRDVHLQFAHKCAVLRSRVQYTFGNDNYGVVLGEVNVDLVGKPGTRVDLFGGVLDGEVDNWVFIDDLESESTVTIDDTGRARVQLDFVVVNPELWSPDNPKLYYLWVGVTVNDLVVDESLDRIGFRDIQVRDNNILLNGEPIFLKGITRHDIFGAAGFTGSPEEMEDDMLTMKLKGINYVRLIHYPHHKRILGLADELGLMVSCEIPAWANFFDPDVRERLYSMYETLIVRDMNHPAVIMWLSGNARARPMPYAKEAQALAKRLDRNRLASYVIDNDEYDPVAVNDDVAFIEEAGLDVYLKVTFWLYYLEFLQDAWTNFPKDIPIIIAEFGFEGNDDAPMIITDEGDELFVTERQQVSAIGEMLEGWRPHLPMYARDEHISGMTLYNWQDLQWPDVQRFLPNHVPSIHFGMRYEDRTPKEALSTLADFYLGLPDEFVGLEAEDEADVEDLFDAARNLSDIVNQLNRDSGPSVSASGNRIYYASDGPDFVSLPKLMVTDLVDGEWAKGHLLEIPQEDGFFAFRRAPCISYDERTLYFTRAILSGIFVAQTRIWESRFVNGKWQAPVDMGDGINFEDPIGVSSDPSISADGKMLYFSSDRPGGLGGTDIWVSENVGGEWKLPDNLGPSVNTQHNDGEPSISADGNTLYFTSGRPGGTGSSDIWVTHRVDGEWAVAKNLGAKVNSTGSDREPEISKDGNFLYFTGIRDGGQGLSDIWFASVPGAPLPSDISNAVAITVTSNNPGTVVVVTPGDVDRLSDGVTDPIIERRFRPGTPVTLSVPSTFNGLGFEHWVVNGVQMDDRVTDLAIVIDEPVSARAVFAVPESIRILGEDSLSFSGATESQANAPYFASVIFSNGDSRTVRSGVAWSVDNDEVASIDTITGVLRPRAMNGQVEIIVRAAVSIAGFELPEAAKTVRIAGEVVADGPAGGGPALCGTIGMVTLFAGFLGRIGLLGLGRRASRRRLGERRVS